MNNFQRFVAAYATISMTLFAGVMVWALAACSPQVAPITADVTAQEQSPQCDLTVSDAVAKGHAVKMTDAQFNAWKKWLADQQAPTPPADVWAYVAPYEDSFAILMSYQDCIILSVEPFSSDELVQMFGQHI